MIAYAQGAASALSAAGGGEMPMTNVLGTYVWASADASSAGAGFMLMAPGWWVTPLIFLIVFLGVARVWRLWLRPPADDTEILAPRM